MFHLLSVKNCVSGGFVVCDQRDIGGSGCMCSGADMECERKSVAKASEYFMALGSGLVPGMESNYWLSSSRKTP